MTKRTESVLGTNESPPATSQLDMGLSVIRDTGVVLLPGE
jgi:hypothetical protein